MSQLRLLQRINLISVKGHTFIPPSFELLYQSVKEHIHKLMNTRTGSVIIDKDYGLPLYIMGRNDEQTLSQYIQNVVKMVENYEPRLQRPFVSDFTEVNSRQEIRYTINGSIMLVGRLSAIALRVIIDDRNKVIIL
ncbi:type VI secretion system baseplate subunit TssE [Kosakonia sp. H7A]|uniref:type VI secretion system baseplate subunit TssE n=1 Tax=Kosakonia sp. H7A TaxID=2054598 RepID=UPI000D1781FE|nr:type VI secretion system baseplate subunit TssE [Kosakonia sp. H7A]PTA88976.1 type VI secretion system baseplate subunit TssE [Kosakonia sp. H7A]